MPKPLLVRTTAPIIKALEGVSVCVLDTETNSLYPWRDGKILAGIGVKPLDGPSFYLTFRHEGGDKNAPLSELAKLGHALRGKELVWHNAKYDLAVLHQDALNLVAERNVDTIVTWRLTSEDEPSYGLKELATKYIDENAKKPEQALKRLMKKMGWERYGQIPADLIVEYVGGDLDYTEWLYKTSMRAIEKRGLQGIHEQEIELTPALFYMEAHGFAVDEKLVRKRYRELGRRIEKLKVELYTEVDNKLVEMADENERVRMTDGEEQAMVAAAEIFYNPQQQRQRPNWECEFTLNDHNDVRKVLQAMGLDSPVTLESGKQSWDKDALALIDHRMARAIVEGRGMIKVYDFYGKFIDLMDADGVVHPSIKQAGAKTGRQSMAGPNLQQIPRDDTAAKNSSAAAKAQDLKWRTAEQEAEVNKGYHERGRVRLFDTEETQINEELRKVRGVFVARPGHFLMPADWSQVELRVLADYANEPEMLKAFELGLDIHALAALGAYGKIPHDADELFTKWWRSMGKQINFGLVYGMGIKLLAIEIGDGSDTTRARAFMDGYFERFGQVDRFRNGVVPRRLRERMELRCLSHNYLRCTRCTEYVERGWLANRYGRRRYLTQRLSYMAVNFLVQGTAADMMKDALIRLHHRLADTGVSMLTTIHDEIIFEVPYSSEVPQWVDLIVNEMETFDLIKRVPIKADLKWSPTSWSAAKSLACEHCTGGTAYDVGADEMFVALERRDWKLLDGVTSKTCEECDGKGYDLSKIKAPKE